MSISGSLETMRLAELFQWAGSHAKSGVLEITEGRSKVQFLFEGGRLVGCASNDPPTLLGQFLLSQGKVDESRLREALEEQERDADGRTLGPILVDQGVLGQQELERSMVAIAEETVFKLFEWPKAEFDFDPRRSVAGGLVKVDLPVDDLLLRGAQRQDELERMKAVFNNPGIVLCRTEQPLHPETAATPMARRLCELVDGQRTFAEILLLSRASEFLATKFLFELYRRGIVAIKDVQPVAPDPGTPEASCELALGLMSRGEHEAALDVLGTASMAHPRHDGVRRAWVKVESAFLDSVYRSDLPPSRIPFPVRRREEIGSAQSLSANELCVLGLIEQEQCEIRSLVRLAPIHEVDLIRSLKGLLRKALIELRDAKEPREAELPDVGTGEAVREDLHFEIERSLDEIMEQTDQSATAAAGDRGE